MTGCCYCVVPALLRRRTTIAAATAVRGAVAATAVAVVRVTVAARKPVHQLLDRVHEEEARAHDELGKQAVHWRFRVERLVGDQPFDALPDLG